MKFKLNLDILKPGDIILVGYNTPLAREIQKSTNSKFSHAMLFWGESIIHVGNIVITENPSRKLFNDDESVAVMRLKDTPGTDLQIAHLIAYALEFVGTLYDTEALIAMKRGRQPQYNPNRQMCAKFVAQCFEYVCRDLVADADSCTPKDIYESPEVYEVGNVLVEASEWDEQFAASLDVTQLHYSAIYEFIKDLNLKYPEEDIMSFPQLHDFLLRNPDKSDEVTQILSKTGYLNLWRKEEEYCPYLYDKGQFKEFWKENQVNQAINVKKSSENIINEKQQEAKEFRKYITVNGSLSYYIARLDLIDNIIQNARKRIEVADQVLEDNRIVKIKFTGGLF